MPNTKTFLLSVVAFTAVASAAPEEDFPTEGVVALIFSWVANLGLLLTSSEDYCINAAFYFVDLMIVMIFSDWE